MPCIADRVAPGTPLGWALHAHPATLLLPAAAWGVVALASLPVRALAWGLGAWGAAALLLIGVLLLARFVARAMTFPGSVGYVARSQEKEVARAVARHRYRPSLAALANAAMRAVTVTESTQSAASASTGERSSSGGGFDAAAAAALLAELQAGLGTWATRADEVGPAPPQASLYHHLLACAIAGCKALQAAVAVARAAPAAFASSANRGGGEDDPFAAAGLASIPLLPTATVPPLPHPLDATALHGPGYAASDTSAVVSFLETWVADPGCSIEARARLVALLVEVAGLYSCWLAALPHPRMHDSEAFALYKEAAGPKSVARGGARTRAAAVAAALVKPGDGWAFWHVAKSEAAVATRLRRREAVAGWAGRLHPAAPRWVAAATRAVSRAVQAVRAAVFVVTAYARFVFAKLSACVCGNGSGWVAAVARWDEAAVARALDAHAGALISDWRGNSTGSSLKSASSEEEAAIAQVLAAVGLASPRFLAAYRALCSAAAGATAAVVAPSPAATSEEGAPDNTEEGEEEDEGDEDTAVALPPAAAAELLPAGHSPPVVSRLPQLLMWEVAAAAPSHHAADAAQLGALATSLQVACRPVAPPAWLALQEPAATPRGGPPLSSPPPTPATPAAAVAAAATRALTRSRRLGLQAAGQAAAFAAALRVGVVSPALVLATLGVRKVGALLCPSRVPHPLAGLPFMRAQLLASHGGLPFTVRVAKHAAVGESNSSSGGSSPAGPRWAASATRVAAKAVAAVRVAALLAWRRLRGVSSVDGSWSLDGIFIPAEKGSSEAGAARPCPLDAACTARSCPCKSLGAASQHAALTGPSADALAAALAAHPTRPVVLLCNPNAGLWEFTAVTSKWLTIYGAGGLGADVVAFNYRGYGRSTGAPGIDAVRADAVAVLQALRRAGLPASRPVIVHGESIGGTAAAALPGRACGAGAGVDVVVADRNFDRLASTAAELVSPAAGLALRAVTAWNASNAGAWLHPWGARGGRAARSAPARLLCADPQDSVIVWSSSLTVGLAQRVLKALDAGARGAAKGGAPSSRLASTKLLVASRGSSIPEAYPHDNGDVSAAVISWVAWSWGWACAAGRLAARVARAVRRRFRKAYLPGLAALPAAPGPASRQLGVAAWNDGRRGVRGAIRGSLGAALATTKVCSSGWRRLQAAVRRQPVPGQDAAGTAAASTSSDSVVIEVGSGQRREATTEPLSPAALTDRLAALLYFTVVRLLRVHAAEIQACWAIARATALAGGPGPASGSGAPSTALRFSRSEDDALVARCLAEAYALHPSLEAAAEEGLCGAFEDAAAAVSPPPGARPALGEASSYGVSTPRSSGSGLALSAKAAGSGLAGSTPGDLQPDTPLPSTVSAPTTPSGGSLRARRSTADSSNPAYLPAPLPPGMVADTGSATGMTSQALSRQPSALTLGPAVGDFVGVSVAGDGGAAGGSGGGGLEAPGARTPPRGGTSAAANNSSGGLPGYTSSDDEGGGGYGSGEEDEGGGLLRADGVPLPEAWDTTPLWHPRDTEAAKQVGAALLSGSKAAGVAAVTAGHAVVASARQLYATWAGGEAGAANPATPAPAAPAPAAALAEAPPCPLCSRPDAAAAWAAAFPRPSEHAAAHAVLRRWGLGPRAAAAPTAAWAEAAGRLAKHLLPPLLVATDNTGESAATPSSLPVLAPLPFHLSQLLGMCRAVTMLEETVAEDSEGAVASPALSGASSAPWQSSVLTAWEDVRVARAREATAATLAAAGSGLVPPALAAAVQDSRALLAKLKGRTGAGPALPRSAGLLALQALLALSNGTGQTLGAALAARSAVAAATGLGAVRSFVQVGLVYGWGGVPAHGSGASLTAEAPGGLEAARRRLLLLLRSGAAAPNSVGEHDGSLSHDLSATLQELLDALVAAEALAASVGRLLRRAGAQGQRRPEDDSSRVALALADANGPAGKLVPLSCGHNNAWSEEEVATIEGLLRGALAAGPGGASSGGLL